MIKAIFMDYMGTLTDENSSYAMALIQYCCKHSRIKDPRQMLSLWYQSHDKLLLKYNGMDFKLEYEIARENFEQMRAMAGFEGDIKEAMALLEQHWTLAPLFQDTKDFFAMRASNL